MVKAMNLALAMLTFNHHSCKPVSKFLFFSQHLESFSDDDQVINIYELPGIFCVEITRQGFNDNNKVRGLRSDPWWTSA